MNRHRILLLVLVLASLFFRFWHLERVPGFNADEAWTPVQVSSWLEGKPAEWITPTGRFISPTFVAATAAVGITLPPSIFAARLSAVLAGLALVVIAFLLLPKALGREVGTVAAIAIAINPTLIAYSRIGWELSQSPIFAFFALYFAWRKRSGWCWVFFVISVVTHSTNVFLAPLLFLPAMLETWERGGNVLRTHAATLGGLSAIALLLFLQAASGGGFNGWAGLSGVLNWLRMPFDYLLNFIGLFSGITVYRDFIGAPPSWLTIGLTLMIGGVLGLSAKELRRLAQDDADLRRTLVAYAVSLAAFFLVGGYRSLTPGYERYALFLILPTLCLAARAIQKMPAGVSSMLATYLIAGFFSGFFVYPEPTGTQVHLAYRTATIDPKRSAFEEIRRESLAASEPIELIAEDWWTYWPMRYFALGDSQIQVRLSDSLEAPRNERALYVGFVNQSEARKVREQAGWTPSFHLSSSGDPIVGVWRKPTNP